MKILLLDAMNLIHRARGGFSKGENAMVFSFFRCLKPIVEKFNADRAYFVLEGRPKQRTGLFSEYKLNRPTLPDEFWRQQKEIVDLISYLPVRTARHPDLECDDVIANLAKEYTENGDEVVIVSGDSDFIQVFDILDSSLVSIYHPIKKSFIDTPEFEYLKWKSLKGDVSDNIPGIPGIGTKRATQYAQSEDRLAELLSDSINREIYERNRSLIEFVWFSGSAVDSGVKVGYPKVSFDYVNSTFKEMLFDSMINEKYWNNFLKAFKSLEHGEENIYN